MIAAARRAGAAVVLIVAATLPVAQAGPTIEALRVEREADRLLVSFDVEDAFGERTLERLAAGLPVVFRHTAEVQSKRALPLWFPRVVSRASVVNRVEYDSLTRRYRLSRQVTVERRGGEATPAGGERFETTESLESVRAFMCQIRDLPVLDLLGVERDGPLRLRVESAVGRRYALLFIPTAVRATAVTRIEP